MANHMRLLEMNPSFRDRLFRLEEDTAKYRATGRKISTVPVATIRVVVHVVYNDPSQNITDAQIKTQISALNKDFRRRNPDRTKTPSVFKGLVSDPRLQFVLNRVTRTQTSKLSFTDDNGVKKAATGGIAPVDTTKSLNIWVCALGGGLLGYAQFPGGPAATDGVVIHYRAFGTKGTATAPYNRGRSATHEIGHYFNLRHIWGDTPDCSGSDLVSDTPNAAGPNFGKPSFPTVTCNNGPNGDMFMNYMDYTDDAAMFMFTAQQVARMRATLDGPRRSLW
jgi:Pregnancy-associated plasma protein-A